MNFDNSVSHLNYFLKKIDNNEPFSIIRLADGEYNIFKNQTLTNCDYWTFNKDDILNKDLTSINIDDIYVGLPCIGCNKEIHDYYMNTLHIHEKYKTFANIFCNKNWSIFISFLKNKNIKFYYIGPGDKDTDELNIIDRFLIDPYLVNNWNNEKYNFINSILSWIDNVNNNESKVFMFSAGPISKIIIPILHKKYPRYTFIDVGSSLDLFTKGNSNRFYINKDDSCSNIICTFNKGHEFSLYTKEDASIFQGGWSYTPNEMYELFKHINIKSNFKILEFGGGDSSNKIYKLISKYCNDIEYDLYENNYEFKIDNENIKTVFYNINEIENIVLPNKKYDLILIDGPNGSFRSLWYEKIRNCIKEDTIILIDDYKHYNIFQTELERNFTYNILSLSDVPFEPYGEHSWRIINNITLKPLISNRDITVILNFYKRPHVILEQLQAVRNQTIPPNKIIIWKNSVDNIELPAEVKNDTSLIIIDCNTNLGVWPRFAAALLSNTPFVCVFDDDTIPGKKWFENCLNTMEKVNGLLGTIGLIFKKESELYENEYPRMGWEGMNNDIQQVDIVGHCWFFKREWLPLLWTVNPDYDLFFRTGEDMGFSWALQQYGINTYVPPHPRDDIEMFGSIPSTAWKYGCEPVSIASSGANFDYVFKYFRERGFKKLRDN